VTTTPRRWPVVATAAVLVAVGATTVVTGIQLSDKQDRIIGCVTGYSNQLADALDARFEASSQAQLALDEFISTVSSATPTPEGRRLAQRALADYQQKRADAKAAQQDNPYPPAPRDACKEAG
jgi:hypothetical protein